MKSRKSSHKIIPIIIIIVCVAAIILLLMPAPVAEACGDSKCSGSETCETCPQDCGECIADLCGNEICDIRLGETCESCEQDCGTCEIPVDLPEVVCNFSTNLDAQQKAIDAKMLEYCNCIDSESLKASCKRSVEDATSYREALDTFNPDLCDGISNPYAKESCAAIVMSGIDHLVANDPTYLIWVYANTQNYEEAIVLLEDLLERDPNNYGTLMALALIHSDLSWEELGQGEHSTKAVDYVTRALEINPDSAMAYRIQGQVYKSQGNMQFSLESYDKSIELDPTLVDAYVGRGHTYRMLGLYMEALADFNKADELDPDDIRIDIYLHKCTLLSGNDEYIEEAEENCRIVIDHPSTVFTSEKADAHIVLAAIYSRVVRYEDALDNLRAALVYQPENTNALSEIAELYNRLDNFTLAEESASKALEIDPMKTTAYMELAYAVYAQGRFDESIETALKGLEVIEDDPSLLDPQKPAVEKELYYMLSTVYSALGDAETRAKYRAMGDAI
jgi:tetratricopeptide (TPR) repeat protein